MNILLVDWNAMGNEYLIKNLRMLGHEVTPIPFDDVSMAENEIEKNISNACQHKDIDAIFSFNYFPSVSNCCLKLGIKYISWVYDSPYINIYSYTVINPCNYIFLFDYGVYDELVSNGIKTVYYQPLAADMSRFANFESNIEAAAKYSSDISFVGSLYNEDKHNLYQKFDKVNQFSKGYLDALIEMQVNIYGESIIEKAITQEVFEEMSKAYPVNPDSPYVMTPKQIYTEYVLLRKTTSVERNRIFENLSKYNAVETKKDIRIYTHENKIALPNIKVCGPVDYYDEMPHVFKNSKINLNISLRSIRTGIPLRVLDIMATGGFVITNYQAEIPEYFRPDEDIVIYSDIDDLIHKVDYYLEHEEERQIIAENGKRKVSEEFDMLKVLPKIISRAFQ